MSRRPPPDTRPDWRDPAMPLARNYVMGDGRPMTIVTPEYEQGFRQYLMNNTTTLPNWRDDPTYNLRRRRCMTYF